MSDQAIETLFEEDRRYPPPPEFAAQANAKADIYDVPFEEFWEREGRERVTWFEPFTSLLEWELPYASWYGGGKINVAYNCLDRHVEAGLGERVAYYYEGEPVDERASITYQQLLDEVVRAANGLKALGRREGHAGRHLHGDGAGPSGRDARVRAARRAAHGRLRRLLGGGARRPAERHALRGAAHAGRELPARDDRSAEAERGRGARVMPGRSCGRRRSAHPRRRPDDAGPRHHLERAGGGAVDGSRVMPVRADGLRRTSSTSSTRAARPRSRRASRTRPPATSSASPRPTTTSST